MNIQKIMHRALKWIQHRGNNGFEKPILEKQLQFMYSFPEPKDDIDRAYYQYLCQKKNQPEWKNMFFNIAAFFWLPLYIIIMLRKGKNQVFKEKTDAVFISYGISADIVPNSLKEEFSQWKEIHFEENLGLRKEDLLWMKEVGKRYKTPYFLLKILVKLTIYSSIIRLYRPIAVISYTEGSFTCALMTKYCEKFGIEHINVQHGEYSYTVNACGMRFHRMYVWEQFFYDSFYTLKGFNVPYYIELPNSILKACKRDVQGPYKYDITYYLQNQNKQELEGIKRMLNLLIKKGYKCKVRPHPRESELNILQQYFSDIVIEDVHSQNLYDSLNSTKYVVSFRSTVLLEAWFNGKEVLIDDYSSKKNWELLKNEDFFLLHKNVMRMSYFINHQL